MRCFSLLKTPTPKRAAPPQRLFKLGCLLSGLGNQGGVVIGLDKMGTEYIEH